MVTATRRVCVQGWGAWLLLLLLSGCVTRVPLASQCLFNGDCVEPLVCAGRTCRAQCQTDRDCTPGQRCAPSEQPLRRVCLPADAPALCVWASDCPCPLICLPGNLCGPQCYTDTDCALLGSGLRCLAADGTPAPPSGGSCSNHPIFDPSSTVCADGGRP